jgi:hypothetical protein
MVFMALVSKRRTVLSSVEKATNGPEKAAAIAVTRNWSKVLTRVTVGALDGARITVATAKLIILSFMTIKRRAGDHV